MLVYILGRGSQTTLAMREIGQFGAQTQNTKLKFSFLSQGEQTRMV